MSEIAQDEPWWMPKHRLFVAERIHRAKLTKKERQLALWLLDACDHEGYVRASPRDLFLQVSGEKPGPYGYLEINYHTVFRSLAALCKADVLAFTWNQNLQGDVAMSFVKWPRGRMYTWDG